MDSVPIDVTVTFPNPLDQWTNYTFENPTRTFIRQVTHGGEMFVAVGSPAGIFSSSDGKTWSQTWKSEVSTTAELDSVAFHGGRFVAVGLGNIVTSTDGIQWTLVSGAYSNKSSTGFSAAVLILTDGGTLVGNFVRNFVEFPNKWPADSTKFPTKFPIKVAIIGITRIAVANAGRLDIVVRHG